MNIISCSCPCSLLLLLLLRALGRVVAWRGRVSQWAAIKDTGVWPGGERPPVQQTHIGPPAGRCSSRPASADLLAIAKDLPSHRNRQSAAKPRPIICRPAVTLLVDG